MSSRLSRPSGGVQRGHAAGPARGSGVRRDVLSRKNPFLGEMWANKVHAAPSFRMDRVAGTRGIFITSASAGGDEPELLERPKRPPPRVTRAPTSGGRRGGGSNRGDHGNRERQNPGGSRPSAPSSFPDVPINNAGNGQAGRNSRRGPHGNSAKGGNKGKGGYDDGPSRGGRGQPGNRSRAQQKINLASRRKARQNRKAERKQEALASAPVREEIFEVGPDGMSVPDLAEMLAVPAVDIVKKLFMKGLAVQVNSTLDSDTVKLVGEEYGVDVLDIDGKVEDSAKKSRDFINEDDIDNLKTRPPVVTVMGHVDHGKTSLLDFVRKAKVAADEAGGITQSIGAYTCKVDYNDERKAVTFLDTPGHEVSFSFRKFQVKNACQ